MPCCIERMRFSPRYSIWRKARIFLVFFLRFFDKSRTSLLQEPELGFFPLKSLRISRLGDFGGYFRPAEGPASGGSSAVEQRTVKCLTFQVAQRSFGREFKSPSPDPFTLRWRGLVRDGSTTSLHRHRHTVISR